MTYKYGVYQTVKGAEIEIWAIFPTKAEAEAEA